MGGLFIIRDAPRSKGASRGLVCGCQKPLIVHFTSAWTVARFSPALSPEWITDRMVFTCASDRVETSTFGAYCWMADVSTIADAEKAMRTRAVAVIRVFHFFSPFV